MCLFGAVPHPRPTPHPSPPPPLTPPLAAALSPCVLVSRPVLAEPPRRRLGLPGVLPYLHLVSRPGRGRGRGGFIAAPSVPSYQMFCHRRLAARPSSGAETSCVASRPAAGPDAGTVLWRGQRMRRCGGPRRLPRCEALRSAPASPRRRALRLGGRASPPTTPGQSGPSGGSVSPCIM